MKDLILFLTRSLVDYPDQVEVREVEEERITIYEVKVAPEDVGKVIGKQGRVVRALRTVVKAAAVRTGKRVGLEVLS
ncbi:MAG: KH domain-containing protein [Firmicutes bacterium]|nr:KH domain-containing protein [Bacillota bacterium]